MRSLLGEAKIECGKSNKLGRGQDGSGVRTKQEKVARKVVRKIFGAQVHSPERSLELRSQIIAEYLYCHILTHKNGKCPVLCI